MRSVPIQGGDGQNVGVDRLLNRRCGEVEVASHHQDLRTLLDQVYRRRLVEVGVDCGVQSPQLELLAQDTAVCVDPVDHYLRRDVGRVVERRHVLTLVDRRPDDDRPRRR